MTAAGVPHIPAWTIGDRCRKAREDVGLGSAAMAEAIGVSRNTVGNVESGRVPPRKIVLNAWALVTGVPIVWLRDGVSPNGPTTQSNPVTTNPQVVGSSPTGPTHVFALQAA